MKRMRIRKISAYNQLKRQLEGAMIKNVDRTSAGRTISKRMEELWLGFSDAEKREVEKRREKYAI